MMPSFRHIRYLGLVLSFTLFVCAPASATSWTYTLDSSCTKLNCNSSGTTITGTWTATESVTGATFSGGTYTRPSPGFLQLNVPSGASSGTGTWKTTPPFSIYAVDMPGIGIISDWMLQSETDTIVLVEDATCLAADYTGNFIVSHLTTNSVMSYSGTPAAGVYAWTNATQTLTINNIFNTTWFASILNTPFSFSGGSCSSGAYTYSSTSDRTGTLWVGVTKGLIYRANSSSHLYFGLPAVSIPSASYLQGTYAVIRDDLNSNAQKQLLPMQVTINASGTSGTLQKLSDPFGGVVDTTTPLTETLTISAINSPSAGFLTGTVQGTHTGKLICAVGINLGDSTATKNALMCTGESPSDSIGGSPFNLFFASQKDFPGGLDQRWKNSGKPSYLVGTADSSFQSVAHQSNDQVVAAGYTNTSPKKVLVSRFLSTGLFDTSWSGNGKAEFGTGTTDAAANSVAIQSDGEVVVGGYTWNTNGVNTSFYLARLNTDGSFDTNFNTTGKITTSITNYDFINTILIQSDGKIVAFGEGDTPSSQAFVVARYTTAGVLDTAFNTTGKRTTQFSSGIGWGKAAALQSDGKIVGAGISGSGTNSAGIGIVRYNTDGSLDTGFGSSGLENYTTSTATYAAPSALAIQSDGKLIVAGCHYSSASTCGVTSGEAWMASRFNTDGSIDTGFGSSGILKSVHSGSAVYGSYSTGLKISSVTTQANGKILMTGYPIGAATNTPFVVLRLNSDGSVDTTFNSSGVVSTSIGSANSQAFGIAIQSNGNITVVGNSYDGTYLEVAVGKYWP